MCYESTLYLLNTNEINVSLMCIGTRHRAGWSNNDMAVSIPKEKFKNTIIGLLKTMNIMENNENKKIIQKKRMDTFKEKLDIKLNYNYYDFSK